MEKTINGRFYDVGVDPYPSAGVNPYPSEGMLFQQTDQLSKMLAENWAYINDIVTSVNKLGMEEEKATKKEMEGNGNTISGRLSILYNEVMIHSEYLKMISGKLNNLV